MLNPGFVIRKALAEWPDAPDLLPQFQFHEKHQAVIHTPHPEKILPLIATFDINQDEVIRRLLSVRQFPQQFRAGNASQAMTKFGLHSFTLLEKSAFTLSYGLRGKFWRTDFGLENMPDIHAFQSAAAPGCATLLMRYRVTALKTDHYALCTETFIHCPDSITQLKMSAYWLAIRLGSGWIRKRMLRSVQSTIQGVV